MSKWRRYIPHRHNWIITAWWWNGGEGENSISGGNDRAVCSFCGKDLEL